MINVVEVSGGFIEVVTEPQTIEFAISQVVIESVEFSGPADVGDLAALFQSS